MDLPELDEQEQVALIEKLKRANKSSEIKFRVGYNNNTDCIRHFMHPTYAIVPRIPWPLSVSIGTGHHSTRYLGLHLLSTTSPWPAANVE